MSSLKVFISSPVYVIIDTALPPLSLLRFVWLNFGLHFLGRVHKILLFCRCRERKRFFMFLREFVVQFKTRKNLRLTIKTLLFLFNSSKGDNGF